MPITTRLALPADYDRVAEVTRAAFLAGPYGHVHANPERQKFELDVAARAAWGAVLVAVDGEQIVGATSLLRALTPKARLAVEGEAEIRLLAVDPAAQGGGIGDALVVASIDLARQWGVSRVVLDTGSLNASAQRLYLRNGFQRTRAAVEDTAEVTSFTYAYDLDDETSPIVRLARPSEYAAVGALTVAAYQADYELPPSYLASLAQTEQRAREHEVWVVEDRLTGELAATVATPRPGAFISDLGQPGELDFRLLAVAPAARGRGFGALLTQHVIGLARERGLHRVVMNSGDIMVGAHRLYEKLGFSRIPERDLSFTDDGRTIVIFTFGLDL
jgi:ribosomal protein S18 acetylase RimI-like enzyme